VPAEKKGRKREKTAKNGPETGQVGLGIWPLTTVISLIFLKPALVRERFLHKYWRRERDVSQPIRKNFSKT
ncbi:MAG: hypothetical protein WCF85_15020, partial [Rhodospirillaceae bacterium]